MAPSQKIPCQTTSSTDIIGLQLVTTLWLNLLSVICLKRIRLLANYFLIFGVVEFKFLPGTKFCVKTFGGNNQVCDIYKQALISFEEPPTCA